MRFALLIALSHLRSRKHEAGVSAITLISMLGVMVGVTALVMVLAVMEGFEVDLRDKILGSNAHLVVLQLGGPFEAYDTVSDSVQSVEGVNAAAPFVYSEVMIRSQWGAAGVVIKGIDPNRTAAVTDIQRNLIVGGSGTLDHDDERAEVLQHLANPPRAVAQDENDTEELPGIIVGEELAEQIKVYPGDKVHVINPIGGGVGPMGMPVPRVQPFRVAGVFYSGMYEYDTKWTYVTIADAQTFLQQGNLATGIEARVEDPDDVDAISIAVEDQLGGGFYVRHWKNLNANLFSALKLEKVVMGLILSLIVMVASLNIVGSLILVVVTRSREISILRAMGASKGAIRMTFMLEGLIIGVVGTVVGTVLGLLGCVALDRYRFPLDTDVYYLDTLPVVVEPETVATVAIAAVVISFLATFYPATVAARVDPVEGLRYE
jgi:lipoprotein-releasing system permease protein